jgi:ABC-2 type transport system permease protein
MNVESTTVLDSTADARDAGSAAPARTRPLYWSVRRELWESRSIYLAPLGVAAFAVVALVIHAGTMPSHMPGMLGNDPGNQGAASVTYRIATLMMFMTTFITGAFYCLEALSSERRDRSILFWKSLPVSDRTTVLAKASVPLVVLPLLAVAATLAMHLSLLLLSFIALVIQGQSVAPLWGELQLPRLWLSLPYAVAAATLWHAPIYTFLLLVSGWARRTAALWAVLPLLALGVLEKLTMDTTQVASLVKYRLIGWYGHAFAPHGPEHVPFTPSSALTPGRFLGAPGLWIGLALAAVFLFAAIRLRRQREPI